MKVYNKKKFIGRIIQTVLVAYACVYPIHLAHMVLILTDDVLNIGNYILISILMYMVVVMSAFAIWGLSIGINNMIKYKYINRWLYWITGEKDADKFLSNV